MSGVPTFVIPVLDEAPSIAGLLARLRDQFPGCPLVVVDGGSSDRTVAEALPLCDQLMMGERGRALQMNLGARAAVSDYMVFLHADTQPQVSCELLQDYLDMQPDWGFCRVRLGGSGVAYRVIEWFMNWRSRLTAVATGDQMLFVRREVFEQTGGFDEIPLMEDVAYSKRLRKLSRPLVIPDPVVTSSRRWEEGGIVATVLRMWALRLGFLLGVSPQVLWKHYYGHSCE